MKYIVRNSLRLHRCRLRKFVASTFVVTALLHAIPKIAYGQVSPEDHAKHHPNQAAQTEGSSSDAGSMMGGQGGGMMGGGMGGMMDEMMRKMGAPKPKDLYPSLMELPDLPLERRGKLEQEAHARMKAGTRLLNEGLEELSQSAAGNNFSAMQAATAKLREGLSDFESGLAAHRALREGKAPRNVALQWFKRELNISEPASYPQTNTLLWGMTPFHTSVMAVLILFSGAMVWMYFFKMRRASSLLEKLASSVETSSSGNIKKPTQEVNIQNKVVASTDTPPTPPETTTLRTKGDCCDPKDSSCATTSNPGSDFEAGQGLLPVTKRKLCRLRLAKIIQETADVKTFRLVSCHGGGIPFSYLPGQFLTFTLPVAEKPIRRSYTISSSPTQGYYCEVTVKREEQGAGSRYLHDKVAVGDTLEVKAPSGKFTFTGEESKSIVLISGGVGITPMMSIARALTDMCWPGQIYFIHACRDPQHFIFEAELKHLQEQCENFQMFVAMSRISNDINGYRSGRINKEILFEWVPDIMTRRIHICGAPAMMDATKEMLLELGVPLESIHTENFGSAHKPKVKAQQSQDSLTQDTTGPKVSFTKSNKTTALQPDETLLEAAERVGVDIDYSCRVGTCGECMVKLLSGEVSMEIEDGLEPEDKQAGMILTCQAKTTKNVSVDA